MSGGTREGAGRKAVEIDPVQLEKLCVMQASDEDLAGLFNVSVRTIQNRRKQPGTAEVMLRGNARGHVNIRGAQMRMLEKGNPSMGIWLGKCQLGQRETSSTRIRLKKIRSAQDVGKAAEKVTRDSARGKMTLAEGDRMMSILQKHAKIIEVVELAGEIEKIKAHLAAAPVSGPQIIGLPDQSKRGSLSGMPGAATGTGEEIK